MDEQYNQYSQAELIQTIGKFYMDLTRSQAVIHQLQQMLQEKDSLITDLHNEYASTDNTSL